MQPHYVVGPAPLSAEHPCCGWCGAVVPAMMQDTHNAWHEQLQQIANQASYADMVTRPIG